MDYFLAIVIGIPVICALLMLAISQSRRGKVEEISSSPDQNHHGTSYTEPQDEGAEIPAPASRNLPAAGGKSR